MHSTLAILTLVSLTSVGYATPAVSEIGESRMFGSRSDLNILRSGLSRISTAFQKRDTQSMHANDGGNADGDEINANTFQVPGTQTTIGFTIDTIGSADAQRSMLNATVNFVQAQLAASGDGQLPQAVDPFLFDLNQGCYLYLTSVKGQHLTWGIMGATVGWLYKHMGEQAQYRRGAGLYVHDSKWGLVGQGRVGFGYTNKPVPAVIPGAAGITHY